MLYEYKIQKIVDGNDDERFKIMVSQVSLKRWWKKQSWKGLNRYTTDSEYNTLGTAQAIVKREMEADAKKEYESNKNKTKVIKEYTFTDIPNHIPEEQEENFCNLKGVEL